MGEGKPHELRLTEKQHCHYCGSKQVRYLRRTRRMYCRICGGEWPAPWVDPPPSKREKRQEKGG